MTQTAAGSAVRSWDDEDPQKASEEQRDARLKLEAVESEVISFISKSDFCLKWFSLHYCTGSKSSEEHGSPPPVNRDGSVPVSVQLVSSGEQQSWVSVMEIPLYQPSSIQGQKASGWAPVLWIHHKNTERLRFNQRKHPHHHLINERKHSSTSSSDPFPRLSPSSLSLSLSALPASFSTLILHLSPPPLHHPSHLIHY